MKQTTKFLHIVMCMALGLSVSLTGCKDYDDDIEALQTQIDANKASIDDILSKIEAGQYVQKVEKIENGLRVTLGDGTTADIVNGKDGLNGQDGQNGQDGAAATIEINEEGYWVINGVATDVLAKGEKGDKGDKGDKGEQGDPGKDGADGQDGQDGQDGTPGKDGQDGKDGVDGKSAYDLYVESLPEGATPLTESEWLRTVAPRINEETGNWEIFDMDKNAWVDTEINARGTDMYVTEVADKSGWILWINEKMTDGTFKAREIFLPAVPATGLTLVYQSMAEDSDMPELIYSLYDKEDDNAMLIAGTGVINFKLFGNNIENNKDNFEYFYDFYQTTKAVTPELEVIGEPVITAQNGYYIVAVETSAKNFVVEEGATESVNYKASLNVSYSSEMSGTAASEYFNIRTKAIDKSDVHAIFEQKKADFIKLSEPEIAFVYTESLHLPDTIYPGFTENGKETVLPFKEVKPEFAIVEETESAKFFNVTEEGTVTAQNIDNDPSAAVDYNCHMTVRYYFMQDGEKVYLTEAEPFTVKAVRAEQPLPEAMVMYDVEGNQNIVLPWSNTEAQSVQIALHEAEYGLYGQLGGRDEFIKNCTDNKNYRLYRYDEGKDEYVVVPRVILTWTEKPAGSTGSDALKLTVTTGTTANDYMPVIPNGTYYVTEVPTTGVQSPLAEMPNFTAKCAVPVTINLTVDLNATVIPNDYYVEIENGKVVIRGEFVLGEKTEDGSHEMKADLSTLFEANPELNLEYALAEEQAEDIAELIENGDLTLNTNGNIELAKNSTLDGEVVDPDNLSAVKIVIKPVGYTGKNTLKDGNAELQFKNPINKEFTAKKIDNIKETAEPVVFDLSALVQELEDVKGHAIISKGAIVVTNATATPATKGWAATYGITAIPTLTEEDIEIPAKVKDAFTFDAATQKLTYDNSSITLTQDIEIKVTPKITTAWGTFSLAPVSFKVLQDTEK